MSTLFTLFSVRARIGTMKPKSTLKPRSAYHHGDLRNALIEHAFAALRTVGPESLSVRALADEIGVSPSAAYRHFADREALLAQLARIGFERSAGKHGGGRRGRSARRAAEIRPCVRWECLRALRGRRTGALPSDVRGATRRKVEVSRAGSGGRPDVRYVAECGHAHGAPRPRRVRRSSSASRCAAGRWCTDSPRCGSTG